MYSKFLFIATLFVLFATVWCPTLQAANLNATLTASAPTDISAGVRETSLSPEAKINWKQRLAIKLVTYKIKKHKSVANPGAANTPNAKGALASMVLGILSLVIPYAGLVLGIIGIVLAAKALKRIEANPELSGRGMAITGLVCSIVGVAIYAVLLIAILISAV